MKCLWCGASCARVEWLSTCLPAGVHGSCGDDNTALWRAMRFAKWRKGRETQDTTAAWRATLLDILLELPL